MLDLFVDFLERWADIKNEYDFKDPKASTDKIFMFKTDFLDALENNPELLAISDIHYSENPVDYIEHWVMTYDPKRRLGKTPFVLFDKQIEFIHWLTDRLKEGEPGLVEKCREVGMSWLSIGWSIWAFKYVDDTKIGFGSKKADLVDKIGSVDSIFGKMRMAFESIPKILQPLGFNMNRDCTFMQILNPENGNSIIGESGDAIGRGGRNSVYFKDESAFYERPDLIEASLSQNTDVQIDISTVNGVGNPFHKKRFSGKVAVFVFRWEDDPRKDQKWYDEQVYKYGSTIVAQEIDRDYESSIDNVVIPSKWVKVAIGLKLEIDKSKDKYGAFDVAGGGIDKNAYPVRQDSTVESIMQWDDEDSVSATFEVIDKGIADHIDVLNIDPIGVGDGAVGTLRQNQPPFEWNGVDSRHSPMDMDFDDTGKNCQDMFINLRAQLFWSLRRRFEKTYDYVTKGTVRPHSELISIPDDPQLISELSLPLYFRREGGKIKIESKEGMKKRGVSSPNMADSVVILFYEDDTNFLGWM